MGTPTRSNTENYLNNYRQVIPIAGRTDMDFMYSEMQQEIYLQNWDMNNNVFRPAAILSGLTPLSLDNTTGVCAVNAGSVYMFGRQENVPNATLNYTSTVANNPIYAQWSLNHITSIQDPTLVDPNTGAAVFEELQTKVVLSNGAGLTSNNFASPDAIDEDFQVFQGTVPFNTRLNAPWVYGGGGNSPQAAPAAFGRYAMGLEYTNGAASILTSPAFPVLASTTYYLYFWTKTYYGFTDLQASDGAYVQVNIATPFKQIFSTTGGATLLGGYTQTSGFFSTGGSDTSATITIEIPSTASPSMTAILFGSLLLTVIPLPSTCLTRHYTQIMSWNRTTTPAVLTPTVTPKSALYLTDLQGTLPATDVTVTTDTYNPTITSPTAGSASDITGPNLEEAVDQLANQRALLGGSVTQTFNVGPATTLTHAPEVSQIQNGSFIWGGTSTNALNSNAYTISISPVPAFLAGARIRFIALTTCTAAGCTLTINGATTYSLQRPDGTNLQKADIIAGEVIEITITSLSPNIAQLYMPPAQYVTQTGGQNYAADVGTANNYTISLSPQPNVIVAGMSVKVKIANPNTSASVLNTNPASGTSTSPIVRPDNSALRQGDLLTGQLAELIFDGASWQLVGLPAALLATTQTSGGIGHTRGYSILKLPYQLSSTPSTILSTSLTMPSTGAPFFYVDLVIHTFTEQLTNPNQTGAIVHVTWSIADSATPTIHSQQLGIVSATADRNNTIKYKHFNDKYMSSTYTPNTTVTFNLQAVAAVNIGTGSEGTYPTVQATSTWLQWIIHSASDAATDSFLP